jgi:hypothetical protein
MNHKRTSRINIQDLKVRKAYTTNKYKNINEWRYKKMMNKKVQRVP